MPWRVAVASGTGGPGGTGGLLQCQQRVDGLPRPDHVVRGAGLGDRGQLPEQVDVMPISA
jgi:hypothetical protein